MPQSGHLSYAGGTVGWEAVIRPPCHLRVEAGGTRPGLQLCFEDHIERRLSGAPDTKISQFRARIG